jgi:hypothetical protein
MSKFGDYEWFRAEVKFNVKGKEVRFNIIHNLPDTFGMDFNSALNCWVFRTKKHTTKSLCEYINSKGISIAMTEKQYKKLSK